MLAPPAALAQTGPSASMLPSDAQRKFLSVQQEETDGPATTTLSTVEVATLPDNSVHSGRKPDEAPTVVPVEAQGQLLILLDPKLRGKQITDALEEHRLTLVRAQPEIGLITVALPKADPASPAEQPAAGTDMSPLAGAAQRLKSDARFLAVTPNTVVTPFQMRSATEAVEPQQFDAAVAEKEDWGIADSGFSSLWPKTTAHFTVGVIDVGFATHDDLDVATDCRSRCPPKIMAITSPGSCARSTTGTARAVR
jgi:hypothetical protein